MRRPSATALAIRVRCRLQMLCVGLRLPSSGWNLSGAQIPSHISVASPSRSRSLSGGPSSFQAEGREFDSLRAHSAVRRSVQLCAANRHCRGFARSEWFRRARASAGPCRRLIATSLLRFSASRGWRRGPLVRVCVMRGPTDAGRRAWFTPESPGEPPAGLRAHGCASGSPRDAFAPTSSTAAAASTRPTSMPSSPSFATSGGLMTDIAARFAENLVVLRGRASLSQGRTAQTRSSSSPGASESSPVSCSPG